MTLRWIGCLLAVACASSSAPPDGPPADAECLDNAGCEIGEICNEAYRCESVGCLTTESCSFGSVCDAVTLECVPGCERDSDCLASEQCDATSSTCVSRTCTQTQTDCAVGEFCDPGTGVCTQAPGTWCDTCPGGDVDCRPQEHCITFGAETVGRCYDPCRDDADCPSGFQCLTVDLQPGGPTNICYANCTFLTENGYL